MSRLVYLLVIVALACAKSASQKVQTLKNSVSAASTVRTSRFQTHSNDVYAKYSKVGQSVTLSEAQQRTVWSNVNGANFDSFAGTEVVYSPI